MASGLLRAKTLFGEMNSPLIRRYQLNLGSAVLNCIWELSAPL